MDWGATDKIRATSKKQLAGYSTLEIVRSGQYSFFEYLNDAKKIFCWRPSLVSKFVFSSFKVPHFIFTPHMHKEKCAK